MSDPMNVVNPVTSPNATTEQISATMTFLNTLCENEEQKAVLNWMATQPKDELVSFMKNAIKTVPKDALPALINQHMSTQTPELRNHIYTQIVAAYDFLSQES